MDGDLLSWQLASLQSQVSSMVAAMGAQAARIKSLTLMLNLDSPNSSTDAGHQLPKAAALNIASILANACPNLIDIGLGGGYAADVLEIFWGNCSKLTSLQLLDDDIPAALLTRLFKLKHLPHITHVSMGQPGYSFAEATFQSTAQQLALLRAVCTCETLTHLHAGAQFLQHSEEWLLLPPSLLELHCHELPSRGIPHSVTLPNLERVQVTCYKEGTGSRELLTLLKAVPNLKLLSSVLKTRCRMDKEMVSPDYYWDVPVTAKGCYLNIKLCTANALLGFQLLNQRVQAGLKLDQFRVTTRTLQDSSALFDFTPVLTLNEILSRLDPLPGFTHCTLEKKYRNVTQHQDLQLLEGLLPNLVVIHLNGRWNDQDVLFFKAPSSLRVIRWKGLETFPKAALLEMLTRMQWVQSLSIDHHKGDRYGDWFYTSTKKLRTMLSTAYSSVVADSSEDGGSVHLDISKEVKQWRASACPCDIRVETWSKRDTTKLKPFSLVRWMEGCDSSYDHPLRRGHRPWSVQEVVD